MAATTRKAFADIPLTDLRIKAGSANNPVPRMHIKHAPPVSSHLAKAIALRDISKDPDYAGKVIWQEAKLHALLTQTMEPETQAALTAHVRRDRFKPFDYARWQKGHSLRYKDRKKQTRSKTKQMLLLALKPQQPCYAI